MAHSAAASHFSAEALKWIRGCAPQHHPVGNSIAYRVLTAINSSVEIGTHLPPAPSAALAFLSGPISHTRLPLRYSRHYHQISRSRIEMVCGYISTRYHSSGSTKTMALVLVFHKIGSLSMPNQGSGHRKDCYLYSGHFQLSSSMRQGNPVYWQDST